MYLDQAATSSLVQVLHHGVEKLGLGYPGRVRLHIQTLLEYDGRGRCGRVRCYDDTYKDQMKTWAERVNWVVDEDEENYFEIKRR